MGILDFFGVGSSVSSGSADLQEVFPLKVNSETFVDIDVMNIYSKILTDCVDRIQEIPDEVSRFLWDNFLQNENPYGLITLLANAMSSKSDLYLVYNRGTAVLRQANEEEQAKIEEDYIKKGESKLGVYISFENYKKSDMVKLYSAMEYCVVASMNKMMNISKTVQYKMSNMRSSVSLVDAPTAIRQAIELSKSLRSGKDIIIDKLDEVVTNSPDISAIKESIMFLDSKRAFYYGMPLSYINGEQTAGIGSTGEADTKAVERGLKSYYISILKPILGALFGIETTFKSNDFRQIGTALEAMKTFDLVGNDLLSRKNKILIIAKLFDVDLDLNDLEAPTPVLAVNNQSQFQKQQVFQ